MAPALAIAGLGGGTAWLAEEEMESIFAAAVGEELCDLVLFAFVVTLTFAGGEHSPQGRFVEDDAAQGQAALECHECEHGAGRVRHHVDLTADGFDEGEEVFDLTGGSV